MDTASSQTDHIPHPSATRSAGSDEIVRHITACQSALYAYVCSLLGCSAAAADVLQETNVILWQKAAEYDADRPFLPWAYRIAYFQVLAHRKRQSRDRLLFDDELLIAIAETMERSDDRAEDELQALDGCISKLPPRQRELLDSKYARGDSLNSLADRLSKAPNAVAAELYRIRKLLLVCIRSRLAGEGAA